jgi:signal transduction histidine kinase
VLTLFAVLFWLVRKAGQTISQQHFDLAEEVKARRSAEDAVHAQNDILEELVRVCTVGYLDAKERAEAASLEKSEFLGNMSHELKTPLHAICAFSDLCLERMGTVSDEKLLGYFERIRRGGATLSGLVDSLLNLEKLEAGKNEFVFETSNVAALAKDVMAEFSHLKTSRGLHFEYGAVPVIVMPRLMLYKLAMCFAI